MTDFELTDRNGVAVVDTTAEKPGIFISYARSDSSALAEELVAGLELVGFRPFLDRHDIAAAEDWEARLGALILGRRYGCLYSLTRRGQVRALCMGSRARR